MILRPLAYGWIGGCLALAAAEIPPDATLMRQIAAPSVSPDGETMVFEWLDDLWTAPTAGGEALRLAESPARDAYPQFTPDGKRIVYSSDTRGSMQIYSMPATGGEALRHTFQTEGNELQCLSPDGNRAIVRGIRERGGFRATRLLVIDLTREAREQRLFDATASSASWSPDGARVLFCRGGEQLYRKGYTGSRASQIWQYDIPSGKFENRVAEKSEARSPLWLPDGESFYYVSARDGTGNLWLQNAGPTAPRQLTRFVGDGVISPALAADGSVLMFRKGLELFKFRPAAEAAPEPVILWTREKLAEVPSDTRKISGTANADFTPNLDQVVFSAAGELWWMPSTGAEPVRLTESVADEGEARFSPDGKWLYFRRDDGLAANYFRARLEAGKLRGEQQVTRGSRSKSRFKISLDGRKIAWVEGTGDVFTAAVDGADAKRVLECWDLPTFDWAPDGRWLAIAAEDKNANRDIWLVDSDGGHAALNLTGHPAFEGSPRWSPDGRRLVFSARREAGGRSQLWQIDFGKGGISDPPPEARLLATGEIDPTRVIWAADSKSLLFQNKKPSDPNLYSIPAAGGSPVAIAESRGVPIRVTDDGSLLWRIGQTPAILKGSRQVLFPISTTLERPREDLLRLGFRRIWRTLGERFYDSTMNGTDWPALLEKYEETAVAARNSRQFDRVVSLLFGELNASHLSFLRKPWKGESQKKPKEEQTAHPGLIFGDGDTDGPLLVERVIVGSSVAQLKDAPEPGEVVVKIAGEEVTRHMPLHRFFNGAEGRPLPIVIRSPGGRERVLELRCISYAQARELDLAEREASARRRATEESGISYLLVPNMSRSSFEELELSVYRESLVSEGLILDFRNNGGGREADRMLALFSQQVHSVTIPRDGPEGYPHARRVHAAWTQPLVVLCNQNTFSNAEIFCHAVTQSERAPLVGTATAGGVISAVKVSIPDAGVLQVPFRGWFQTGSGENLDLNGARPDFPVELTPADENAGLDPQLEKAVEILKKAMAANSAPVAPRLRR